MTTETGAENEKPRKRAQKPIIVGVLETRGQSALVEWPDGDEVRRCYVPVEEIEDGKVPREVLEAGIPYGAPWAELAAEIGLPAGYAARFATALRRRGVWTSDDLERNPKSATAALVEVTGVTTSALRRAAIANKQQED